MGLPAIVARAFPGKREEANRAGITPKIRVGTIDVSTAHPRLANIRRALARVRVLRDWLLASRHAAGYCAAFASGTAINLRNSAAGLSCTSRRVPSNPPLPIRPMA